MAEVSHLSSYLTEDLSNPKRELKRVFSLAQSLQYWTLIMPTTCLLTLQIDLLYIEHHERPKASNEQVVAGLFAP